jgi:DNA-binding CsgD family transcriptional regulator
MHDRQGSERASARGELPCTMDRLRNDDYRRLTHAVRQLHEPERVQPLIARILELNAALVPSAIVAHGECDPSTGFCVYEQARGDSSRGPSPAMFPALLASIHEHPLLVHYRNTGDERPRTISDVCGRREFHRLRLYAELYRPLGIEDQLVLGIRAAGSRVMGFSFSRESPSFSERDRLLLDLFRPHVLAAQANARQLERSGFTIEALLGGIEEEHVGVLVVDARGHVVSGTRRAWHWLRLYLDSRASPSRGLPDSLLRWFRATASRLFAPGQVPIPPAPLTVDRSGGRLIVRLMYQAEPERAVLTMREEVSSSPGPFDERLPLTPREAQVLEWIAKGKSNRDIATILDIRIATVKKHLERVFDKLDCDSRTGALLRAREMARDGWETPEVRAGS